MKQSLSHCPCCDHSLYIAAYGCKNCGTQVQGEFREDTFSQLGQDDRMFSLIFLQCGGRISQVEQVMGISYPTVKSRLERVIQLLGGEPDTRREDEPMIASAAPAKSGSGQSSMMDILSRIESGTLSVDDGLSEFGSA